MAKIPPSSTYWPGTPPIQHSCLDLAHRTAATTAHVPSKPYTLQLTCQIRMPYFCEVLPHTSSATVCPCCALHIAPRAPTLPGQLAPPALLAPRGQLNTECSEAGACQAAVQQTSKHPNIEAICKDAHRPVPLGMLKARPPEKVLLWLLLQQQLLLLLLSLKTSSPHRQSPMPANVPCCAARPQPAAATSFCQQASRDQATTHQLPTPGSCCQPVAWHATDGRASSCYVPCCCSQKVKGHPGAPGAEALVPA
jgi:hypothetical protein